MRGGSTTGVLPAFGATVSWSSVRSTRIASLGDVSSGGCASSSATSVAILFETVKSLFSGEKLRACGTADGGETSPSDESEHLDAALLLLPVAGAGLTVDFFRGSEDSCRADTHRGEARALGTVFGVIRGRPESRRPAGVGKADILAAPKRLCEAGPEERRAGVLWTAALSTDVQDCSLCARENLGVELPGGSPGETPKGRDKNYWERLPLFTRGWNTLTATQPDCRAWGRTAHAADSGRPHVGRRADLCQE